MQNIIRKPVYFLHFQNDECYIANKFSLFKFIFKNKKIADINNQLFQ